MTFFCILLCKQVPPRSDLDITLIYDISMLKNVHVDNNHTFGMAVIYSKRLLVNIDSYY